MKKLLSAIILVAALVAPAYGLKVYQGGTLEVRPITGAAGADAAQVSLRVDSGYIQWQREGGSWTNLIEVATLKGADGEEVSLQVAGGYIQWRLGDGSWTNLIEVATLKGDPGDPGAPGDPGTPGADGTQILSGTVDPTTEGADGDFYFNTDTVTIFGPKDTTWPAGIPLGSNVDVDEIATPSGVVLLAYDPAGSGSWKVVYPDGTTVELYDDDGTTKLRAIGGGGTEIEILSADPATPSAGDAWVNTTDEVFRIKSADGVWTVPAIYEVDPTPPTITGVSIGTGGVLWTLTASEAITAGVGGPGGMVGACATAGAVELTYNSGDGTTTPAYAGSPMVYSGDTCTLFYTQPGDGWEDGDGDELASFSGRDVSNGSTESAPSGGISLDSTSYGTADNSSTITFAHTTTTESNRLLFVFVHHGNEANAISGVTYDDVAMTQAWNTTGSGADNSGWYLVAPATGENNVVVTFEGSARYLSAISASFTGVHQSTPIGTAATHGVSSTEQTLSVESAEGDLVVGYATLSSNVAVTDNQTEIDAIGQTATYMGYASSKAGEETSTTLSWDLVSAIWVRKGGVALKPVE